MICRILLLQRREHALADRALLAEEAVGLDEMRLARGRPGQLGKAAAGNAPVRDTGTVQPMRSRDFITCAPGGALTTRMMLSAPASFSRVSCGTMSTSLFSNFSTPTISTAWIGLGRGLQALFVALAPRIVDEHQAGFLGAEFLRRRI